MNSSTTLPSLNAFTAGIDWIPNACESRGLASVSTLTSSTWPARLSTAFSITGPSERHGTAPLGPEVDDHGLLVGALDDVALEGVFSGVDGHAARIDPMDFRIDADGVTLSGEEAGEGSPVVLLHGLTATRRYVVMGSRALERAGHRVIAYDARAHGQSDPARDPHDYGYERLARRPAGGARRPRHRPRRPGRRLDGRAHADARSRSRTPSASRAS